MYCIRNEKWNARNHSNFVLPSSVAVIILFLWMKHDLCMPKVQQSLAIRVLDRLVAGADEDAFEFSDAAATGDDYAAGYSRTRSRQVPGGGSNSNLTLAGAANTKRRRPSATPPLSVGGAHTGRRKHISDIMCTYHMIG